MSRSPLVSGILFALGAGLAWGLVFISPLLLPDYPATLQSFGRYLAFGLIALPLGWIDRRQLATLTRADWVEALKLALIGNIVYYLFLAAAIRRAGAALPTLIIGTLPVVIAIASLFGNDHGGSGTPRPAWNHLLPALASSLGPSLLLIGAGIALVNRAELVRLRGGGDDDLAGYAIGAVLAIGAVICWTWYPLRNAAWLRRNTDRSARGWATAQGLATLPLAVVGYALTWTWNASRGDPFPMPFGPRPLAFVGLMVAIGLLASWLGTVCWNAASQRLPPALAGQLIVFETLAALGYAMVLRGTWPPAETLVGIGLLVGGVIRAVRCARPSVTGSAGPPHRAEESPPPARSERRRRR